MLSQSTLKVNATQRLSLHHVGSERLVNGIGGFRRFLLIQLLDVGQVEGAEGVGCSDLTLVNELQVKIRFPFRRDEGKVLKDGVIGEGAPVYLARVGFAVEPVKHDQVGRDEQKPGRVAAAVLGAEEAIEILPDDRQRHDEGLAGAGGHLEAVLGPVIRGGVEGQADAEVAGEAVEVVVTAHFIDIDERLYRLALGAPEFEGHHG